MGCFSSKPEAEPSYKQQQRAPAAAAPVSTAATVPASATVPAPIPRAKPVITEADRAKHKLKHQRDALERVLRRSEDVMVRDLELARSLHAEGKRESALVLMRRRALVQKRVQVTSAQVGKIEDALGTLEGTEATAAILDAVAAGTRAVEQLNAVVSVERAEQIMRESEDADAYAREVGAVLTGTEEIIDEDDIMAQIAEFESGENQNVLDDIPTKSPAEAALEQAPLVPNVVPQPPAPQVEQPEAAPTAPPTSSTPLLA